MTIKVDRTAAATALFTSLQTIGCLAVLTAPFLPDSAQRLWAMLGLPEAVSANPRLLQPSGEPDMGLNRTVVVLASEASAAWATPRLAPGHQLGRPAPLIRKLEEDGWEAETARLLANLER